MAGGRPPNSQMQGHSLVSLEWSYPMAIRGCQGTSGLLWICAFGTHSYRDGFSLFLED
jgi:hypothetical protein